MNTDLGKFRQTLKDVCPNCGEGNHLQVRSFGEVYYGNRFFAKENIVCPRCGYSLELRPEKRRAKRNIDTEWE